MALLPHALRVVCLREPMRSISTRVKGQHIQIWWTIKRAVIWHETCIRWKRTALHCRSAVVSPSLLTSCIRDIQCSSLVCRPWPLTTYWYSNKGAGTVLPWENWHSSMCLSLRFAGWAALQAVFIAEDTPAREERTFNSKWLKATTPLPVEKVGVAQRETKASEQFSHDNCCSRIKKLALALQADRRRSHWIQDKKKHLQWGSYKRTCN